MRISLERFADELRRNQTPMEVRIGGYLTEMGFKAQQPVMGRYVVDFLHPQLRIAVEIDGRSHWVSIEKRLKDARRERWLRRHGGLSGLIRLTDAEVMQDLRGCLRRVRLLMVEVGRRVERRAEVRRKSAKKRALKWG